MQLSIVIPAYNEAEHLSQSIEKTKQALSEVGFKFGEYEIIVCDNASNDSTAKVATNLGVKVVTEQIRQISQVRNTGAAAAEGHYLMFLDADSHPSPGLLVDMIAAIADPAILGGGSTVQVQGGTLFNRLRMERLNPLFRLFQISGGAFLFCETAAFYAIGGFAWHLYVFEDIEFVMRLKAYGLKKGQRFALLWPHPVITSGRRGELSPISLLRLFTSNFLAALVLALSFLLPKKLIRSIGSRVFGYWYAR